MRIEVDENGYVYVIGQDGKKRYLLVDVPNCPVYGKIKIESIEESEQ